MQTQTFSQLQKSNHQVEPRFNFKQRASPEMGAISALQLFPTTGKNSPAFDTLLQTPMRHTQQQMNSTGQSFFRQSMTIESPSRISATKKLMSPAIPGGFSLNSPCNDPAENALMRENNRVAGFGPGMASSIIGNSNRRGQSLTVSDTKDHRTALSTIGWGIKNQNLDQGVWRRLLPDMPHKKAFDQNGLNNLPQLDTTGKFASHLDAQLGIPYEMLDDLSVRE